MNIDGENIFNTFFHDEHKKQSIVLFTIVVIMSPIEMTDIFISLYVVIDVTKIYMFFITIKLR